MIDSTSSVQHFARDLHQDVMVRACNDSNPRLREDAFTESVLELLEEHNEVDGWEISHYEAKHAGRTPAAKLNAWALSGDGTSLDLFVTRYNGTGETHDIGRPETRRHFELGFGFLKRALDGFHATIEESSDAFVAAQRIYEARDLLTTVRLFFLTDGIVRSLELDQITAPGLDLRYSIWDLEKLSRLRVGERELIELDFENDYGGPISCLQTADATGEYRTFLAYLPARLLARIYGEHGQRLLERNVRAFLQARGKVNRGLQTTLKSEPHRFLAYNNGLCCTAADIRVKTGRDGHAWLQWARDFQIVNGGQTTASIFHALKKEKVDITHVVVQVKLTVLSDPSKVSDMVPLISRYANSQNKVNTADFSANGRYHHNLEQLSRTVWAPAASGLERGTHWYYERARGSYADDKARQGPPAARRNWETQNPTQQKFTKTDLAKFEHAWLGLPHFVCLGAEKNFNRYAERMDQAGEPIVDQQHFRQLIAKAILFRTAEKLFSSLQLSGYRANAVAYAVSWLAVHSEWRLDLDSIWQEQHLPPGLREVLKLTCAAAHGHITSQPGNPGEASKRETCWRDFNDLELPLGDSWMQELSETPFVAPTGEGSDLARQWETIRHEFCNDTRTLGDLESATGKVWVATRRKDEIGAYARQSWDELQSIPGLGLKKLRGLVEIMSIAEK